MTAITEKKHIPLIPSEQNPETHLELSISYQRDTYNWYNGANEHRGYYLYCSPVERRTIHGGNGRELVTWTQQLGKGKKILLLEISRRGKKAEEKALTISAEKEAELIQAVCNAYGLVLKEAG